MVKIPLKIAQKVPKWLSVDANGQKYVFNRPTGGLNCSNKD
jgi:hypothetical protein